MRVTPDFARAGAACTGIVVAGASAADGVAAEPDFGAGAAEAGETDAGTAGVVEAGDEVAPVAAFGSVMLG